MQYIHTDDKGRFLITNYMVGINGINSTDDVRLLLPYFNYNKIFNSVFNEYI